MMLAVTAPKAVMAQEISLTGTDFWVSFMMNHWPSTQQYNIIVSSVDSCTATIENPRTGWDSTVVVSAGGSVVVRVPGIETEVPFGHSVGNDAWHVTTTAPAAVFASNLIAHSHDMTAVIPTPSLRCNYMTQTYGGDISGGPEVNIVACHDSTAVSIFLSEDITQRSNYQTTTLISAGDSIKYLLMRGQTCRLRSSSRGGFCGTTVHSSKPVAVFQGNMLTCIPGLNEFGSHMYPAQDHLYEQCTPHEYWGMHFLIIPTNGRVTDPNDTLELGAMSAGDIVKVTARDDNCVVTVGGTTAATLATGESYTFVVADHPATLPSDIPLPHYNADVLSVSTSSPVMLCQYITSNIFGGKPGDPAQVVVPPIEQRIGDAIIPVYNSNYTQHHTLNVLAPEAGITHLKLDGNSIGSYFIQTDYGLSYARIPIGEGTHLLDGGGYTFQAILYGLGDYESYATVAAMALYNVQYSVDVSRRILCTGDSITVTVTHSDELNIDWVLDSTALPAIGDTLRLAFDSAGQYHLGIVILPIGDTLWEQFTVKNGHSWRTLTDTVVICPHDSLVWNGHIFNAEGVYYDTLTTVQGCDSILSLRLEHWPAFLATYSDTICPRDTLLWRGHRLTAAGTYCDSLLTAEGCDSVEVMQLALRPLPNISINVRPDCSAHRYNILAMVDTIGLGSPAIHWTSSPADNTLDGQPWHNIGVSPQFSTFYTLAVEGRCLYDTTILLQPIRWPVARMKVRPERLELGQSEFDAYDVSLNADSRMWMADGHFAGTAPALHGTVDATADSILLTLVASNDACSDTLNRTIYVNRADIWVPNAFTPDKNDNNRFAPVLNHCTAEELFIYNRSGLLVLHIEGDNPVWDGMGEHGPCQQGTYVWMLVYHSDAIPECRKTTFGTVTLIR